MSMFLFTAVESGRVALFLGGPADVLVISTGLKRLAVTKLRMEDLATAWFGVVDEAPPDGSCRSSVACLAFSRLIVILTGKVGSWGSFQDKLPEIEVFIQLFHSVGTCGTV